MKAIVSLIGLGAVSLASADIGWNVTFDDPSGTYSSLYETMTRNMVEAGRTWGRSLTGMGTIDIQIGFANIATANGGSATSQFSHMNGTTSVYEWNTQTEIRTGVDINGSTPDVYINFGFNPLATTYWWDPNPELRTEVVPSNKVDAFGTCLHEIGHALAFNGWRNGTTGALPGNYMSRFDERVTRSNGYLWFDGPNTRAAYGSALPLTLGNYGHYGNAAPGPGSELAGYGLMNGVVNFLGYRRTIQPRDLAVLYDMGYAPVPEPSTLVALTVGGIALVRRRRRSFRAKR